MKGATLCETLTVANSRNPEVRGPEPLDNPLLAALLAPLDDLRDQYEGALASMTAIVAELAGLRARASGTGEAALSSAEAHVRPAPLEPEREGTSAGTRGIRPIELQVRGADFDQLLDLQQRLSDLADVTRVVVTGVQHGKATLLMDMGEPEVPSQPVSPGASSPPEGLPTLVCAWCDAVLSVGGPQISHGLCAACAQPFMLGNRT